MIQNSKKQIFKEVETGSQFEDKVVEISRISRTVAGGRRIRFRVLVVAGNRRGKVGIGVSKATEVSEAVKKAKLQAQKNAREILIKNETIHHRIIESFGAARILLKPAKSGTGIIAGGAVRTVLDLAGIKNVVSKTLGDKNKINNSKATFNALIKLTPNQK